MCIKKETSNCKLCAKFYCKTTSELPICKKCLNGFYLKKKEKLVISTVEKDIENFTQMVGIIQSTTTTIIYEDLDYNGNDIQNVKYFSKTEKVNHTIEAKDFEYKTLM